MTPPVRPATRADVNAMAALWHEGWHDTHARLMPAEYVGVRTLESFRERLLAALPDTRVVELQGEPAGFCILKADELYQLYVSSAARGTGVAAALLSEAEERLRARGVETGWLACAVGNDRAGRFYEKGGWRRVATVEYQPDAAPGLASMQVWRYEKHLLG